MTNIFECLDQPPEDRAKLIAANVVLECVHEEEFLASCKMELEILKKQLLADFGLLLCRDNHDALVCINTRDSLPRTIKYSELEEVKHSISENRPFFCWDTQHWKYFIAHPVMRGKDFIMYTLLCRNDTPFSDDEKNIFKNAAMILSEYEINRYDKACEEINRQRAQLALQRSEARLRTFFEQARDFKYMTNADDIVAAINNAGMNLLHVTDRFEVVGRPMDRWALSPEDRQQVRQKIEEQGFIEDFEVIIITADNTKCVCLESAQAVHDESGKLIEIHGSLRNITERITLEQQLWALNLEVVEANNQLKSTQLQMVQREKLASIGQLAAGIAHEINNPLGFLMSNHSMLGKFIKKIELACEKAKSLGSGIYESIAEGLDLDYVSSEVLVLLAESNEGYARISEIVKHLKNFARIDDVEKFTEYDLEKGIESTLVVARNELKYAAELSTNFCSAPTIQANGGQINQVLLNVLVNSAQAVKSKFGDILGHIIISTQVAEDTVVCIIEDDGPGISEDNLLKIFDPFYTTKAPGEGTGMGLSLSYDIVVNKHHGKLLAGHSSLGGALFRIELPIKHLPN